MNKPRIHLINENISKRAHPISFTVIGAGGNGSFFLQELARIAIAYEQLYDNSISVVCYDGDKVEDHNLGRQLFFEPDVGKNKANIMISRINLTYGFDWESQPKYWKKKDDLEANFVIGCVDNVKTRKNMIKMFEKISGTPYEMNKNIYYLDIGNMESYGQVIMGTNRHEESKNCDFHHLMHFGEYFNINKMDDSVGKNVPSCSMQESISSQDLFVNRIAATLGANLIWQLLKKEYINYHGYMFNLEEGKVDKILI